MRGTQGKPARLNGYQIAPGGEVTDRYVIDDSRTTTREDGKFVTEDRPLAMRVISWRKKDVSMVVVITRLESENLTHIVLIAREDGS